MVTGMAEYIKREALLCMVQPDDPSDEKAAITIATAKKLIRNIVSRTPASDVAPIRHGRWILQANNERTNYRWNVIAECSECCDERKEIWAGFFPNVPDWLVRDVAIESAKSVKLSNYCPNCGAKMDLRTNDE